jgi:hypothetical protein
MFVPSLSWQKDYFYIKWQTGIETEQWLNETGSGKRRF